MIEVTALTLPPSRNPGDIFVKVCWIFLDFKHGRFNACVLFYAGYPF